MDVERAQGSGPWLGAVASCWAELKQALWGQLEEGKSLE